MVKVKDHWSVVKGHWSVVKGHWSNEFQVSRLMGQESVVKGLWSRVMIRDHYQKSGSMSEVKGH